MPHSWVSRSDMGTRPATRAARIAPAPRGGSGDGGDGGRRRQSAPISASLPPRSTAFSKPREFRSETEARAPHGAGETERNHGAVSPWKHGGTGDASKLDVRDSWPRRDPRLNPTPSDLPSVVTLPGIVRGWQPRLQQAVAFPSVIMSPSVVALMRSNSAMPSAFRTTPSSAAAPGSNAAKFVSLGVHSWLLPRGAIRRHVSPGPTITSRAAPPSRWFGFSRGRTGTGRARRSP